MTAKERLESARKAREELAASRKPSEEEALEAAAVAEELALKNDQAVAAAEKEHGKKNIAVVTTDGDCVIVKRPNSVLFRKFQDEVAKNDGIATSDQQERLVFSCLVYPDKPRFGAMTEEQPVLIQRCLLAIADLAGAKRAELGGKY